MISKSIFDITGSYRKDINEGGDSPALAYSLHPDFLRMQFQAFYTITLKSKAAFQPVYPSVHSILHPEGDTIPEYSVNFHKYKMHLQGNQVYEASRLCRQC